MQPSKALEFYRLTQANPPLLTVGGVIRQADLSAYSQLLKSRIPANPNMQAILLTVFIELAQNILRYSAEQSEGEGVGVIWITAEATGYRVQSGNLVTPEQADPLKRWMDEFNPLDAEGLKALRKQRLHHPPPEGSRGAGLGLLEVRRRSMKPVEYAFIPTENEHIFFSLTVNLSTESL